MVAVSTTDPDGNWQTGTILRCLSEVVPLLADDAVLVVRSTIPPDFVRQLGAIVDEIRDQAGRPRVPVMLNPEFTRESQAVADFLGPGPGRCRDHPRPRWARRPDRPARLPPGRCPDHHPARRRCLAVQARRQPLPGDEDLVRQRARPAVRRVRRSGRRGRRGDGLRRRGSAAASSRPASATAARACRTRSPRPSATRRGSGSRPRSWPRSTGSTTISAPSSSSDWPR